MHKAAREKERIQSTEPASKTRNFEAKEKRKVNDQPDKTKNEPKKPKKRHKLIRERVNKANGNHTIVGQK